MRGMRGLTRTITILLAAAILLPGTGCTWLNKDTYNPATDTRPEPKLKKTPYTVNGSRYRPMGMLQALEYSETGEASVYKGGNSRGALGERLPYGGMYAAHRTLPMPCMVRVTSLSAAWYG